MSVKNILPHNTEIKIGETTYKLLFTMEGGEYLALKYDSILNLFDKLDAMTKEKSKLRLTAEQINLVADSFYACAIDQFTSAQGVKKIMNLHNMADILQAAKLSILLNNPQSEEGAPESPPVTP